MEIKNIFEYPFGVCLVCWRIHRRFKYKGNVCYTPKCLLSQAKLSDWEYVKARNVAENLIRVAIGLPTIEDRDARLKAFYYSPLAVSSGCCNRRIKPTHQSSQGREIGPMRIKDKSLTDTLKALGWRHEPANHGRQRIFNDKNEDLGSMTASGVWALLRELKLIN